MDSLTQITLGAAVGELCLGKKIGNKAMFWGGLAGTIPDLDIIGNLFMNEVQSLAFHRGISHSIFFAVTSSFLFAWLVHRLYNSSKSQSLADEGKIELPSYKDWYVMFFLAFFTHIMLDCFTAYGTLVFAPFSNYRVAFNNIAVADLFYTLPFIFCLVVAGNYSRQNKRRKKWAWAGVIISSAYMLFTIINMQYIKTVMNKSIVHHEIDAERYILNPSLLQNFLWSGTIETDSHYYQGTYSMFDKDPYFKLNKVEKGMEYIADAKADDKTINTVKWFSKDYLHCLRREDGRLQLNDMRYGNFGGNSYLENDFVFRFIIEKQADGYYEMTETGKGPPDGKRSGVFGDIYSRMIGNNE